MGKQYGLILKKKDTKPALQKSKLSFFDDDNSDEDTKAAIEKDLLKVSAKKKINKQTQLDVQRALEQDPTVYEYDELYDDMKAEKEDQKKEKKDPKNRKSKYMDGIMKTFQKRALLHARREERKAHKERAEEKDEFADKEQFITNAYREKLKEMKAAEEEEARMDKIEEIMDVTKQKDMSGFYKHFLNRQVGGRNIRKKKNESESEEENTDDDEPIVDRIERDHNEVKEDVVKEETVKVENSNDAATTPVKREKNEDADSDFLSEDENKVDVKNEQGEVDVKTDPNIKLEGEEYSGRRKSETLDEFKQRLKQKKERRLDVYRTKHTKETLDVYRQRYLERREKKRQEGLFV